MLLQIARLSSLAPVQSSKGATESLQTLARNNVGSHTDRLWQDVMEMYEKEANLVLRLSISFRTDFKAKLDARSGAPGSDFKVEDERDNNNWRQLCDTARAESRAESKYRQTQLQQENARERILSTGDEGRDRAVSEDAKPRKRLILAGGEAMKKLQEKAKLAMAQKNLNDADQVIAKEKQIYEVAMAAKSKKVAEYKTVTEARLKKLEMLNEERWAEINELLGSISQQVKTVQVSRQENWESPLLRDHQTYEESIADMQEWVESTSTTIQGQNIPKVGVPPEESNPDPALGGYQLSVVLDDSEGVSEILALKGTEDRVAVLEIDVDKLSTEEYAEASTISGQDSSSDAPKQVLHKSISVPLVKDEVHANNDVPSSPSRLETKQDKQGDERPEIVAFMQEFGFNTPEEAPQILEVINCTYRPKEKASFLVPLLHGRLYTTTDNLYFLAWDGKSFVLSWSRVLSIQKEKGFMGEWSISVTFTSDETQSVFSLGRLETAEKILVHLCELLERSKEKVEPRGTVVDGELPPVPPDETLKKMEVVLSKTIRNTSIQKFYEKVSKHAPVLSLFPFLSDD
jgi:hypothetical protein